MPKKIDPALRERAVRLVREHRAEYPTITAAVTAVARQEGVGYESLRRWVAQADIDAGDREPAGLALRTGRSRLESMPCHTRTGGSHVAFTTCRV